MTVICLIDLMGDHAELSFTGVYRTSRAGLVETWVYTNKIWLPKYPQIPIPVLTEWFDEAD